MIFKKMSHSFLTALLVLQSFPCLTLTQPKHCKVVAPIAHFTPEAAQAMVENIRERMVVAQENGDTKEVQRLLAELEQIIARARAASAEESRSAVSTKKSSFSKGSVAPIISSYNHDENTSWSSVIGTGVGLALLVGMTVPLIVIMWKMMFEITKKGTF
jgi:hypothetical protein